MNWYKKSKDETFKVSGLIVACFGKRYEEKLKKYNLEIEELFQGDPWIASAKSTKGSSLSKMDIENIVLDYKYDPDNKGVPYYFAVEDSTGKEYVVFNDDGRLVPINSTEEKNSAKEIGIKKGLVKEQLDF